MSLEQLKAFLEKVKADTSLQEKLKAAADSDAVVAIAKDQGYQFTADKVSQVSEWELESAAGGESSFVGACTGCECMDSNVCFSI